MGRWFAAMATAAALLGCGDEHLRKIPCVQQQQDFDIEQVSALEGVYLVASGADAVVVDADRSRVPADGTWRVGQVEVLVAVKDAEFADYPRDAALAVEVWDGEKPTASQPWRVSQTLDTSALSWKAEWVAPAEGGAPAAHRLAWWKFDFSAVVPEQGMSASRYIVGLRWTSPQRPLVGASRFNRPCARNWTDYDDGRGWVLTRAEAATPATGPCSRWPARSSRCGKPARDVSHGEFTARVSARSPTARPQSGAFQWTATRAGS